MSEKERREKSVEWKVKAFDQLTLEELYEILRLRSEVFILEQNAPCREIDGRDQEALHVFLREEGRIVAYLRVLGPGVVFPEASLGRVIAVKRRQGLGTAVTKAGIRAAKEKFGAEKIRIESQSYVKGLYEKLGFRQVSEEFLDHGIPHVQMLLEQVDGRFERPDTEEKA